jgi:hypothetical protein
MTQMLTVCVMKMKSQVAKTPQRVITTRLRQTIPALAHTQRRTTTALEIA